MGTRHLVAAVIDGEFKIAQYGQWDGYPSGQGDTVLTFLKNADMEKFKERLRKCSFLTSEELKEIDDLYPTGLWVKKFPHLSRDAGAKILTMVNQSPDGLALKDTRSFAGDGLFCEYAYVLDCDNDVLEVYTGFHKDPTPADSRFPSGADWLEVQEGYSPVKLMATYPFNDLPTVEQIEKDLGEHDDENEE